MIVSSSILLLPTYGQTLFVVLNFTTSNTGQACEVRESKNRYAYLNLAIIYLKIGTLLKFDGGTYQKRSFLIPAPTTSNQTIKINSPKYANHRKPVSTPG